jgi:hypothetical protein
MARKSKVVANIEALRLELWPNINDLHVWNRQTSDGFSTIPRTLSQIGSMADALSGKGKPVMQTYLELWCRVYDNGFVNLSRQQEIAFASGFSGQRAVATWRERMKRLQELDFIDIKAGPSGPFSYALIINPYWVVASHKKKGTALFPNDRYSALFERSLEIGATDLAEFNKSLAAAAT